MTTPAPGSPGTTAPASRSTFLAWTLWDVGNASFNAIMTTFVFTVYLTSSSFGTTEHTSAVLSAGLTIAGICIALLAPLSGQRADITGRRGLWLTVNSLLLVLLMALCFFVAPSPDYLLWGVALLALGNLVNEFAVVNYNAILPTISTRDTIGKMSGTGWAAGYFGGIVALVLVLVGFISPGLLGITEDGALNIRAVALFSAVWALVFSLPLILKVRSLPQAMRPDAPRVGILASYKQLIATVVRLYRQAPTTLYFLVSSAIFRDGLNGIFTFGGMLAAGSFGFSTNQVIIFAIFGNIVAGAGAMLGGFFDDRFGPKRVIIFSLVALIAAAVPLLVWPSTTMFWVCGLTLCAFVGPAQSAARSYLGRLVEEGQEGEIYGLYSTTGRAASFLAPALFGLFVTLMGSQIWGIVGIVIVLLAGLLLMIPIKDPQVSTAR
ncbi:MAG: MFS transporter [Rothia sp. (in: high G+C Gram-positive bacteria)]|uniref:MFS transporter n=1 Tax=Rothia sp. (in: high G+C Gram-positive bacteria) TaxID=1885016 RepID=UPI0026F89BCE|nr:MFS transporter [Rothia sp. (in: high G+C Gram-positive bacteria)]